MANAKERAILSSFIALYRDLPCLWDMGSDSYKDKNQKAQAWSLLVDKIKLLEPEANAATAKRKVEHMRSAYKRERKKVRNSLRTGCRASAVHVPNLWYYKSLTFLEKKDELHSCEVNTISSDEESQQSEERTKAESSSAAAKTKRLTSQFLDSKRQKLINTAQKKTNSFGVYVGEQLHMASTNQRQIAKTLISEESQQSEEPAKAECSSAASTKHLTSHIIDSKRQPLINTAQQLLQADNKKTNSFGVYVGEQLDMVSRNQRHIAEKLISEVIFLAKTENLALDSKVVTPSSRDFYRSPDHDPLAQPISPEFIQTSHPSSSPQIRSFPSTQITGSDRDLAYDGNARSVLRDLLIVKNESE